MMSCLLARGQEKSDTIDLLNTYANAEVNVWSSLNDKLDAEGQLTIDKFGKYSCLFSEAMENTLIGFALENRTNVQLHLEYYEIEFHNAQKEEEYYLQRTFTEYYPDHLLDFLELKMFYEDPVTMEMLRGTHRSLMLDEFENNFNVVKNLPLKVVNREDIEITKPSIFVNDVPLTGEQSPDEFMTSISGDCGFGHCFLTCLNIQYDFIYFSIGAYCGAVCASIISPAGFTGVPEVGCVVCIVGLSAYAATCATECLFDPCRYGDTSCEPGEPIPGSSPICSDGVRMRLYCPASGEGAPVLQEDPCPIGYFCDGAGICQKCDPKDRPSEVEPNDVPHDSGNGNFNDNNNGSREAEGCNNPITIPNSNYILQHETAPGTQDGFISVAPVGGYDNNYVYLWDDPFNSTSNEISGLSAGTYCVTVTGTRCCYASRCFTLVELACQNLTWNLESYITTACNGDDGEIEIVQGQQDYTYLWSNGATSSVIDNLVPGFYDLTVTNGDGCTTIKSFLVTGDDGNPVNVEGVVSGICPDNPNAATGAINLYIQASVQMISYSWSNDNGYTAYTEDIDELEAGIYTVTATDECSGTHTASFEISVMGASAELVHNNVPWECAGVIDITITQGQPPFTIDYNGPTSSGYETTTENNYSLTELCTGNYAITITDNQDCSTTLNENICDCPDIIWGEWTYDHVTDLVCRPWTLPASASCEAANGTQCFTPQIDNNWTYDEVTEQYCRNINCPPGENCEGYVNVLTECFDPIYSGWYYSSGADKYCRDITCEGQYFCDNMILYDCHDFEIGSCTPDDDDECACEVLVDEEFIGVYEYQEAEIEWSYDVDDNICIQITYCDGSQVDMCEHDPINYGDWEFDVDQEICIREVVCADDQDDLYLQNDDDPDIEWEYDDFWEVCIATVECGGIFGDEVEVEGEIEYTDWNLQLQTQVAECHATINCGFDNGNDYVEVDEYVELSEIIGWEVQEELEGVFVCEIFVSCGDGQYESSYDGVAIIEPDDDFELCTISCTGGAGLGEEVEVPCDYINITDEGDVVFHSINDVEKFLEFNRKRQEKLNALISILPNPFKENFQIDNLPVDQGDLKIEILNSNGLLIESMYTNQEKSLILNTTKWAEGIYFVNIYNEDHTFSQSKRVVKVN